jgi:hypothetical protein
MANDRDSMSEAQRIRKLRAENMARCVKAGIAVGLEERQVRRNKGRSMKRARDIRAKAAKHAFVGGRVSPR